MEKEITSLKNQEKKLTGDIKKSAKMNQMVRSNSSIPYDVLVFRSSFLFQEFR